MIHVNTNDRSDFAVPRYWLPEVLTDTPWSKATTINRVRRYQC